MTYDFERLLQYFVVSHSRLNFELFEVFVKKEIGNQASYLFMLELFLIGDENADRGKSFKQKYSGNTF